MGHWGIFRGSFETCFRILDVKVAIFFAQNYVQDMLKMEIADSTKAGGKTLIFPLIFEVLGRPKYLKIEKKHGKGQRIAGLENCRIGGWQ